MSQNFSGSSSEDEEELRAMPTGVVRKRKGWEGGDLEQAHTQSIISDKMSSTDRKSNTENTDEFRNVEVGGELVMNPVK
tara:strand:+ start:419 stop:655 length:237 start_codon:yes stop_codon:yes gene_type:complete